VDNKVIPILLKHCVVDLYWRDRVLKPDGTHSASGQDSSHASVLETRILFRLIGRVTHVCLVNFIFGLGYVKDVLDVHLGEHDLLCLIYLNSVELVGHFVAPVLQVLSRVLISKTKMVDFVCHID
jgi:hypothetical protein